MSYTSCLKDGCGKECEVNEIIDAIIAKPMVEAGLGKMEDREAIVNMSNMLNNLMTDWTSVIIISMGCLVLIILIILTVIMYLKKETEKSVH